MTSCANILVDTRRLKFGDDMIDKLVLLRMNKKSMDRMRCRTTFANMAFDTMDARKRRKVQIVIFDFLLLFYVFQ